MTDCTDRAGGMTIGLDLGDKWSQLCVLDAGGEVVEEGRVPTTDSAMRKCFRSRAAARVALEVGSHCRWISAVLEECGHEVIVANPRKLRMISENDKKNDRADAEILARVARVDAKLLAPIHLRGPRAQNHLSILRARDALVAARTQLVNHARGAVKCTGARLPSCSTDSFAAKAADSIPAALEPALSPVIATIKGLTATIRLYDKSIESACEAEYPETQRLQQVAGVGPVTALTYVLTIEDPTRFKKSRTVGSYLGLTPREKQSGDRNPELKISKAGDVAVRRLLICAAHYILGPFGPDTDLRRFGLELAERGRKNAKKRAIVAVARKLAVLLHRLWVSGADYDPLRQGREEAHQRGKDGTARLAERVGARSARGRPDHAIEMTTTNV